MPSLSRKEAWPAFDLSSKAADDDEHSIVLSSPPFRLLYPSLHPLPISTMPGASLRNAVKRKTHKERAQP